MQKVFLEESDAVYVIEIPTEAMPLAYNSFDLEASFFAKARERQLYA